MKLFIHFIRLHRIKFLLILIILLAISWCFYNLSDRWGIAYNHARDVIIARYALDTHQLPLLGHFSSAGAFIYVPQWFWIVMIGRLFYLPSSMKAWIWQGVLCVGVTMLSFIIGRKISILTATTSAEFVKSVYNMNGIIVIDINSSSSSKLKERDWYQINPEDISCSRRHA